LPAIAGTAGQIGAVPQEERRPMTWDEISGNWRVLKPRMHRHWYRLTNDDVASINGEREILIRRLEERYGFSREHAEREVDAWTWLVRMPRV
jgi:uncharacterized protein YjbJ (UPF0337 family)